MPNAMITATKLVSLLITFLLVISLTGCLSQPKLYTPSGNLADQQNWQLKARVAIKTPEDSVNATLDWQTQSQAFDFHLYGTFGVTYAQLIQEPNQAVLKLPDDKIFYHQDAQQLLYQSLGWDFPIEALSFWIKGLPSYKPGEIVSRNEAGQLAEVLLNDWQIEFQRYKQYAGYTMPRIVKATHPQMSLKVVVKEWEFLPNQ
ncbi:outer membrane lipoprotein LolB [Aliikangiella marina]|uniref:Outer-membrane lipoprotein LolB n=1 Tax=Aliikangiella marina TaxID=1712262 RepID=A0A545TGW0_9GAMM|nr:lipoprotein insertase outer membrane protein LolB [Aliikangiella marina]TQV76472.1 outer membrane lipoprotein LolB [Aliikangiella marina]